jgi:glucose-6-phosphate 1-dehydrogenase
MTTTAATDPVDALVIFGATGDLAKLETFPALALIIHGGCRVARRLGCRDLHLRF